MKSGVALLLAVVLGITGVGLLRQGVGGCPGGVCGASMLLSAAGLAIRR